MFASYTYDAWGKVTSVTNNTLLDIGNLNPFRYRGYYYDTETSLYYLETRYYDPEVGRFISPDSIEYLDPESINGLNLYAYCLNNPVMYSDETGCLPNWAKWLIGVIAFAGAVALTALTGGALTPVFISMGASILLSGVINGAVSAVNGENFWEGFSDGAADGAMWGGIFSLGGAAFRTVKMFKNGVALGENMKRISSLAKINGQVTYKGTPGFKLIQFFKGHTYARKVSIAHNKAFIDRMMRWGVKLVDYGIDVSRPDRSWYYLMETIVTNGYQYLNIIY